MAIDYLERQEFVETLVKIVQQLAANHKGCTFAINGKWGVGKSFILDRFKEQLQNLHSLNESELSHFYVFRYNCWEYDFYDEPAIALVAALHDEMEKQSSPSEQLPKDMQKFGDVLLRILAKLAISGFKCISPLNIEPVLEAIKEAYSEADAFDKADHEYDSYFSFKTELDTLRNALAALAEKNTVIILIDELDRCIPTYAIKVLERLHHLFSEQKNIIVVLAIDQDQLSHSIEQIYGVRDIESISDYLKKFISFSISLDEGKVSTSFWEKYQDYLNLFDIDDADNSLLFELPTHLFYGIDVRTQEKLMERIILLHNLSFDVKEGLSVLYFELLHQVLSYKCRNRDSSNLERSIIEPNWNQYFHIDLGEELHSYIIQLEQQLVAHEKQAPGIRKQIIKYLITSPLSTTFSWFAMIANKKDNDSRIAVSYFPVNSGFYKFRDLPPGIDKFITFSKYMEFK